ncbi:restriction endonuclease subunit S [Marinilactibacillus psychrotolerans]|uniref:restriction endonuclease subunit S n=1 Tax=Marinilactibacillus psychrotolerans TaxID=191770 RepID=UPI0024C3D864|nr:restriction endonuclease subunit S [Marinilactibacillus psychrotolerans]
MYAWEQRKLINVAGYRNGKAHEQDIDESGKYIVVNSKFVSTNGSVKKYSSSLKEPLQIGEIAFVLSDVPSGKAIARTFLVSEDGKYSLNQRIAGITPYESTDSYFLSILMNRNKYFLRFDNGVGQTNLSKAEVENFPEYYPNFDEQQSVGLFFKKLDITIALHQCKLDKLNSLKKAYLQFLFPEKDKNSPRIRFVNFTKNWEQRKVGEFLSESRISGSNGKVAKKLTVKLWRKGVISKEDKYQGSEATNYYIRKKGQFIYGKLDFLNQAFGIIPDYLDGYESTLDLPSFNISKNLDSFFFIEYISRKQFYLYQGIIANGSRKAKRIHPDTFYNMPLLIPNIKEQFKIGLFFKQIDNTINLHQQKLHKLKELKKAYLKKMFV